MKVKLNTALSVSITEDLWSTKGFEPFLGATTTYISSNYEIETAVLAVDHFLHPHTALRIREKMMLVMDEFISSNMKHVVITTDSASNQKAAFPLEEESDADDTTDANEVDKGDIEQYVQVGII